MEKKLGFNDDLEKYIFNPDFGWDKKSIQDFWKENFNEIHENEDFLLFKMQEYAPSKTLDFSDFFSRLLYFFRYKKEEKFYSQKVIDFLKTELKGQRKTEKPEFYSNILATIFAIEGKKAEQDFYQKEYKSIKKKGFLYSDISTCFLEIFIKIGEDRKNVVTEFSDVFYEVIIQSIDEIIPSSIENAWNYLVSLEKQDFIREFFRLLNSFNTYEDKHKLIYHYKYTSIYTLQKYETESIKFEKIKKKIIDSFGVENYKDFEEFIISDIKFALDEHDRDIEKNIFLSHGIDILQEKDSDFIIRLLRSIDSKINIWGLEKTIVKYLLESHIETFISIFKGTHDDYIIFRVYETAKGEKNELLVQTFEASTYKNELKKIQTQRDKSKKKYDIEEKKRLDKEKQEFLSMMVPLEKGQYIPKLFHDYVEYISGNNQKLSIYSKQEQENINKSIISQINTYFSYKEIKEYSQNWLEFVTFEKTAENSYSHCWDVRYMTWFLQIAQTLPDVEEILKKHYKTIILFYPLMYGDQVEEYFFNSILPEKLEQNDIEYILKAYSEDLHHNAQNLRYYHPRNFTNFYKKFQKLFKGNEKKLEEISFHMISETQELEVYYREEYLGIYAEAVGEKKYRKYWNIQKEKYPKFNYFKDILKNQGEKEGEELKEMRFFLTIQTVLVERFAKKSDIIWRIKQFIGIELKHTSIHTLKYPYYSGVLTTWSGEGAYSEIEWSSFDRENFAYIFSLENVGKIDVSTQMLKILDESLEIKSLEDSEQNLYANYLQKVFFKYFEVFDDLLFSKSFYKDIQALLDNFLIKVTYDFNIAFFKKKIINSQLGNKVLTKKEIEKILIQNLDLEEKNSRLLSENQKILYKNLKLEGEKDNLKNIRGLKSILEGSPILFVEGKTDKAYLEHYYDILQNNKREKKRPFIIQLGGCSTLTHTLMTFLEENNEIPIIGMFDFDSAGIEEFYHFNEKKGFTIVQDNYNEGYMKKNSKGVYVFLLPVPNNRISKQVLKKIQVGEGSEVSTKDYGKISLLEIEHLFYELNYIGDKNRVALETYLFKEEEIFGFNRIELKISNKDKMTTFGKITSGEIFVEKNNKYEEGIFENFKPIIDIIDRIASGEFEDKT